MSPAEPQPTARNVKTALGSLRSLAPVPAAVLAVLPSFSCPVCIAAYAGVLSAAGLGFIFDSTVQTPLIAGLLLVGIGSVAFASRSHNNRAPLVLTLVGTAAVVVGKLVWDLPFLLYAGAALLFAAALYNLWLKRPRRRQVSALADEPESADHVPPVHVAVRIEGMSCGGCVGQLETALRGLAGVRSVELQGERATIEYDPSRTSREQLTRAIEELGYRAMAWA